LVLLGQRALHFDPLLCAGLGPGWLDKRVWRVRRGLLLYWRFRRYLPALLGGKVRHFGKLNGCMLGPVPRRLVFDRRRLDYALHALPRGLLLRAWRDGACSLRCGNVLCCQPAHRLLN
jgi:hypothetical protein